MNRKADEIKLHAYRSLANALVAFVKSSPLTYTMIFGTKELPYRDGIAFLFFPPQLSFDRMQSLHLLRAMTIADDSSMTIRKGFGYIRFIKRDIFDEGLSFPADMEKTADIEDIEIEKYKDMLRAKTEELLDDLK